MTMLSMRRPRRTTAAPDEAPDAPEERALQEAIRAKLSVLLQAPLTPRSLLQIEATARLGRELVAVGLDAEALASTPFGNGGGYYLEDTDQGNTRAETFAATLLREFVALNKPRETSSDIVAAIAEAKKQGLDDVAARLQEKLDLPLAADAVDVAGVAL
jgi:hypothetical protein